MLLSSWTPVEDSVTCVPPALGHIAVLTQTIAELTATIKALDEQVAAATEQRKEENAEFKQLMTDNSAAKELLKIALAVSGSS